jgi:uncharacterized protein (TIGR03435 family)
MLQMLLEDRFKLKTHRETKEIPAYWLVVAKGGPKLRDVKEEEAFNAAHAGKSPFRPGFMAIFSNKSLPEFAQRLALDRPVIDKTGIEGRFWFQLEWADEPGQARPGLVLQATPAPNGLGRTVRAQGGRATSIDRDPYHRPRGETL